MSLVISGKHRQLQTFDMDARCSTLDFDDEETHSWWIRPDRIIQANATSTYAATTEFVACNVGGEWVVSLYTGRGVLSSATCAVTQLQVADDSATPA